MASISIEQIDYPAFKGTSELIRASGNLPFQYYDELPRDKLAKYHYDKTAEALSAGKLRAFAVMVEDRPRGLLLIEPLLWDNEVLGISCFSIRDLIVPEGPAQDETAKLLVDFAIELCSSEGGELLVAKTDPVAHYLVKAFGLAKFEHMSTLIFYGFDMRKSEPPPAKGGFTYRPFVEEDEPLIQDLAQRGFADHFDRYTLDKRIPEDKGHYDGGSFQDTAHSDHGRDHLCGHATAGHGQGGIRQSHRTAFCRDRDRRTERQYPAHTGVYSHAVQWY